MNRSTFIFPHRIGAFTQGKGRRIWVIVWLICCLAIFAPYPASAQKPSAPSNFSVAAGTGIATWDAVTGATAYALELRVGASGSIASLSPGVVDRVNFTVAPNATNCCKTGATYYSRIKVTTSGGDSDWTDPWTEFAFTGTTSFTGTPFSVSISLSYDHSAGSLRVSTSTNGGTGTLGTTRCAFIQGGTFSCPTGIATRTVPAGDSYTVTASNTRGTEKHSATATINVPLSSGEQRRGDRAPRREPEAEPNPTVNPDYVLIPTQDHSRLPAGAEVSSDSIWVSMREVSGSAISDPWVRESAIAAIDLGAPLGLDAEVCFAEAGSPLLLDAAYSPRRLVWLEAYQRADGMTCARVDRNGTLVLMPSQSAATPAPRPIATRIPQLIPDRLDSVIALEDCMVSARSVLRFRDRPAGRSLRLFRGASAALARTQNWFKVSYEGREGWISAHYVTTNGDCG